MRHIATPGEPIIVAHRAGNDLDAMLRACALGVDLIEADVHSHRGRLEARHFKTMGPVPLLWDRWALARGWTPRLPLRELLFSVPPSCEMMLDLKGRGPRFPVEALRTVQEAMPNRPYTVCSQLWNALIPFSDDPQARVIHSIGSARALKRVLPMLEDERFDGVSIHKKLLTEATVQELLRRVSLVMTWPANHAAEIRKLQDWGVNGFIVDDEDLLRRLVSDRTARTSES